MLTDLPNGVSSCSRSLQKPYRDTIATLGVPESGHGKDLDVQPSPPAIFHILELYALSLRNLVQDAYDRIRRSHR